MTDQTIPHPEIQVMLVEDHALTRMGLKTALKRTEDIKVITEASNGQEAIELAEKHHPDVILMDVGMPVMDGIQSAREILAVKPNIRIIMLTQHDNDRDVMASLSAGASGYCLKDIEPERLYMAIRSVFSGDAWLDAGIAGRVLKHYSATPASSLSTKDESLPSQSSPTLDNSAGKSTEMPELPVYAEPLSPRELEVLKLIVNGLSNQEIANQLLISLPTAKTHVRNILNKLAVDDRTQAAVHAMRRGLV
ncbi:MAG: response regulator transcription factor [Candidatus Obscuribacterales bacterium]